jgi:acyl transferase domain-containing protein
MQTLSSPKRDLFHEIIALSAANRDDLKKQLVLLKEQMSGDPGESKIAYFAEISRNSFRSKDQFRLLLVIDPNENPAQLVELAISGLESHPETINWSEKSIYYGENPDCGKLAFVFPGQGSQYVNMGKDIMNCFPEAQQALDHADSVFKGEKILRNYIYPDTSEDGEEEGLTHEDRLRSTDVAQPAIGAVSLAMIKVLGGFNVHAQAACGHSYGELPALFSSGRIDEAAFLHLSVARGKFMAQAGKGKDSGTMLAVKAPLDQIEALLKTAQTEVILANKNSPDQGVLSGPTEEILRIKNLCKENKIRATPLPVAAAFHSTLVSDAAAPFQKALEQFEFHLSPVLVYSNTTAAPYPDSPQETKTLLGRHLINPVNFVDEIKRMHDDGCRIFLEVGPKSVLTGLIKSILEGTNFFTMAVDGSSGRRPGIGDLARALCKLASIGFPVNLTRWRKI